MLQYEVRRIYQVSGRVTRPVSRRFSRSPPQAEVVVRSFLVVLSVVCQVALHELKPFLCLSLCFTYQIPASAEPHKSFLYLLLPLHPISWSSFVLASYLAFCAHVALQCQWSLFFCFVASGGDGYYTAYLRFLAQEMILIWRARIFEVLSAEAGRKVSFIASKDHGVYQSIPPENPKLTFWLVIGITWFYFKSGFLYFKQI